MAKKTVAITALFLDIGGVLLTNGWDHAARARAAEKFHLDFPDMESRHHLTFDTYEVGKITLKEYLRRTVFYTKRSFTERQFCDFMFQQSKSFHDMLKLISVLKKKYRLKIVVVSNEGRELNEYRIKKFRLDRFVDFFVSSSFVHFRKPDEDMYKIALDMAQVPIEEILYIDDRSMFVEVAARLGIRGIHHTDYKSTVKKLSQVGLHESS